MSFGPNLYLDRKQINIIQTSLQHQRVQKSLGAEQHILVLIKPELHSEIASPQTCTTVNAITL